MRYLGTIADSSDISQERLKERIVTCYGDGQRVFVYKYFFYDRFFYHVYNVDETKESFSQILEV